MVVVRKRALHQELYIISSLVSRIKTNPDDFDGYLKDIAIRLTQTPVPPAGMLALRFNLFGEAVRLLPAAFPGKQVIDIPLSCIFYCLPVDDILKVVSCLLLQQRTLFLSANYALLTITQEAFLNFIYPFMWRYTYVPVLANNLLEYIEAPGTWIMGCSSIHRNQVQQVEGIVVVDLDYGCVNVCETLLVPEIPKHCVDAFKESFKSAKVHYELETVDRLSPLTMEEMATSRRQHQFRFHQNIVGCFVQLMVNLFGDVRSYINVDKAKFKHKAFLSSRATEEKPFYEEFLQTDLFNKFLQERFAQKRDLWSMMEEKTRAPPTTRKTSRSSSHRGSQSGLLLVRESDDILDFVLPKYVAKGGRHFIERAIDELSTCITNSKSSSLRASYLYLRGMLHITRDNVLNGLEDFCALSANDTRLFPKTVVDNVISDMSISSREALMKQPIFTKLNRQFNVSVSTAMLENVDFTLEHEVTPEDDVAFAEFAELISSVEICHDYDTLQRLFKALTITRQPNGTMGPSLDPVTFDIFHECWRENEVHCQSLLASDDQLEAGEMILKVSPLVKSDTGTGYLILTSKRLLFVLDGRDMLIEIVMLKNILKLEKFKQTTFLSSVDTLAIYSVGGPRYVVCLKDQRNEWAMLITEMWSGVTIAGALRDGGIVQQAAQNVQLLDALIFSGRDEESSHHLVVEKAARILCHFTNQREAGGGVLPQGTEEVLQRKINPNANELERSTVEALLYTPGRMDSNEQMAIEPMLWVGMGSGKVKVYNASKWFLVSECIQAEKKVVCLLAVGDHQVWAGSFDHVIYIIDVATATCNQKLLEHDDMMSHMTLSEDKSLVFTASLNGQIITWDAESLTKIGSAIHLTAIQGLQSIVVKEDCLWCGVKKEILVVNRHGDVLRRLFYEDKQLKRKIQIDCFLVTNNGQVWTGSGRNNEMIVWDAENFSQVKKFTVECRGFSRMVLVGNKIWAGSKNGLIYIFNTYDCSLEKKVLSAHLGEAIRSMCVADDRYVISGSVTSEGKIAIWSTTSTTPTTPIVSMKSRSEFEAIGEEPEDEDDAAEV
ncbi:DENN domain-containing protein 3-like isoform X2 [Tubulanus polymorphus]|uniref:DENN domain-containing protein 3-like isoform X2 n=1 Tax=Tubulanus polymorphus TaxID=672921 RepID=UPI003DA35B0F